MPPPRKGRPQDFNLPDDKMVKLRKLFADSDTDHSGNIDKNELALLAEKLLGYQLPTNELDDLMNKMDIDGDGSVNFLEFVRGAPSWMLEDVPKAQHKRKERPARLLAPEQLAQLRQIFGHSDQDGSGAIDADEFSALLESFGVVKTEEEIGALMEDMGSSAEGTLSFVQLVQRAPQWLLIKYLEQLFARRLGLTTEQTVLVSGTFFDVDADKDTKLVQHELQELVALYGIEATPENVANFTTILNGTSADNPVSFIDFMNNIEKLVDIEKLKSTNKVAARGNWRVKQDIVYAATFSAKPVLRKTKNALPTPTSAVPTTSPRPATSPRSTTTVTTNAKSPVAQPIKHKQPKKPKKAVVSRQEWEDRSWDLVLVIRRLQQQLAEEQQEKEKLKQQINTIKEKNKEEALELKQLIQQIKEVELDKEIIQAPPLEIKKMLEGKDRDEIESEFIKLTRTTKRLEHALKVSEEELAASKKKKADQKQKMKNKLKSANQAHEDMRKDHNELTIRFRSLHREKDGMLEEFDRVFEKREAHKALVNHLMRREMKLLQQLEAWSHED